MIIDETFHAPRTPVAVVALGPANEAFVVRAALENLGAAVLLHLIGTPADFLAVLGQGESAPDYVVICGHGDETGFVFGDYGPGIDASMLLQGALPADALDGRIRLPGRTVVSTACVSGTRAFADVFLRGGVDAYIAPDGYPDGADAGLFVHLLFDKLLRKRLTGAAAADQVRKYDPAFSVFRTHISTKPCSEADDLER